MEISIDEPDTFFQRRPHDERGPRYPRRGPIGQPYGAIVYLLGMGLTTVIGTAFVVFGLQAGASGLNGVVLAAAFPLAGLLWAITLSVLHREHTRVRRVDRPRVDRRDDR